MLYYVDSNNSKIEVPLVKKGIAWWTDKHVKFRNPAGNSNLTLAFQGDICTQFTGLYARRLELQ